ncbi:hypothetical protein IU450_35760 [Nocardia abscessus]|uniref:hypothetical protein n=1 Tax=Nocardia abscessus TaxID=120957 RepID=UPI001892DDD8|nr:hypothetical protein [Nocardia abscessus]MBF6341199.1 hypothetical protein [Nocardia abscessus]
MSPNAGMFSNAPAPVWTLKSSTKADTKAGARPTHVVVDGPPHRTPTAHPTD